MLLPLGLAAQNAGGAAPVATRGDAPADAAAAQTDDQASETDWLPPGAEELPPGFEMLPPGAVRLPDYKPRITDPLAVARGKSLYTTLGCSFCHGADARGGSGGVSLLRSQKVLTDRQGERIYGTVAKGVSGTAMVAFDLTPAQVADIAEFLHSFPVGGRDKVREAPASIVTGSAEAGRRYFDRTCSACHAASGDLHGIATRYPKPRTLQQRWLLPRSAQKARVRVQQADGTVIQGALVRRDEFLITMKLNDGTQRTFGLEGAAPKVEVSDPLAGHKNLLPTYTDRDIHDVTAYLVTLQ